VLDPFVRLVVKGFSPASAARLVALKRRAEQGAFRETTDAEKRREFGRWLVDHGRVSESRRGEQTRRLTMVVVGVDSAIGW
jgi:hypothetical protein